MFPLLSFISANRAFLMLHLAIINGASVFHVKRKIIIMIWWQFGLSSYLRLDCTALFALQ